jgi:hypothetical protein
VRVEDEDICAQYQRLRAAEPDTSAVTWETIDQLLQKGEEAAAVYFARELVVREVSTGTSSQLPNQLEILKKLKSIIDRMGVL